MASLADIDPSLRDMSFADVNPSTASTSQDRQGADGNSIPGEQSMPLAEAIQVDIPSGLPGTNQTGLRVNYAAFRLNNLKDQCKSRKLKRGGRKHELVSRLESDDARQMSSISTPTQSHAAPNSDIGNSSVALTSKSAEGRSLQNSSPNIRDFQSVEINPVQVNSESAALNTYFQAGFQGEDSDDDIRKTPNELFCTSEPNGSLRTKCYKMVYNYASRVENGA